MADNITLNSGTGGATLAADDVSSVWYQRIKLTDGTADSTTAILAGNGVASGALRVTLASDGTGVVKLWDGTDTALVTAGGALNVIANANSGVDIGDVDVTTMPGTAAEAAALPGVFVVVAGDDGTDTQPLQLSAGGDLKVTLDSEAVILGAGSAAVGKLAANSGVDIGDVDVTSVVPGTAATNLGKAEDAAHSSGDTGVYVLAVRDDALAAHSGTDGDYESLHTDAAGALWVHKQPTDIDVTLHSNYTKKYYTNAGAVTDGIIWSPAAGKRWHVVNLFINISAAATITLEDDKAGGDDPVLKMELAANSGIMIPFGDEYPLASAEDAADLLITTSAGNVYVTVTGYEI